MTANTIHKVELEAGKQRVRVTFNGKVIAETERPLIVRETGYPEIYYLPEAGLKPGFFTVSERRSYCPYKGEAHYRHLVDGDIKAENAVWTYPHPIAGVEELAGHFAFYRDRVDAIQIER